MFALSSLLLPAWFLPVVAFGFGVIIGSFLNVYIYRFHTGKSLSGSSHCLSCGTPLTWYELFPLLSYLALRGRCRSCGCSIPARYFVVELLTGILFVATMLVIDDLVLLLLFWAVFSILVVITVYDFYHFIIPDSLTAAVLVVLLSGVGYQYWLGTLSFEHAWLTLAAALGGAGFFLFLWVVSRGAWLGFGDVKLAVPLGIMVGPTLVFSFVVLSFWIGAAISLAIIGWVHLKRGKERLQLPSSALTMKSAVPFAPFLIASSVITFFTHFNVLELFTFI